MRRLQFSLRTLLIVALILGPLSGWYGPVIVEGLRNLVAEDPTPTRRLPPTPIPIPRPQPILQTFQEQFDAEERQRVKMARVYERTDAERQKQRALTTLHARESLQLQRLKELCVDLRYDVSDDRPWHKINEP